MRPSRATVCLSAMERQRDKMRLLIIRRHETVFHFGQQLYESQNDGWTAGAGFVPVDRGEHSGRSIEIAGHHARQRH